MSAADLINGEWVGGWCKCVHYSSSDPDAFLQKTVCTEYGIQYTIQYATVQCSVADLIIGKCAVSDVQQIFSALSSCVSSYSQELQMYDHTGYI